MSNGEQFGAYRLLQRLDAVGPLVRYIALPGDDEGGDADLCVLQCLQGDASADLELGLRYRQLMSQEARLRHDAIVGVREIGECDGQPYMTYELRDGVDLEMLAKVSASTGRPMLSASLAATVVDEVLAGLSAAHGQGIYHRGLTPRLVIIDEVGDVSITGFAEGNLLSQFPQLLPDPRLYAPELRKVRVPAVDPGPQPDCYAVGMLLYRLLTGKPQPDEWESPWAGLMMDMAAAGVPGESLSRAVDFIQRTLAERPTQRFPTIAALQAAFRPLLEELGGPKHRALLAQAVGRLFPHMRKTLKPPARPQHFSQNLSQNLSSSDRWAITPISDVVIIDNHGPRTTPAHPDLIEASRLPAHVRSGLTPISSIRNGLSVAEDGDGAPRTRILGPNSRSSMRAISPELRDMVRAAHPLEVLAGTRYEVLEELGVGGTGTVYKVRDTTLDEILALKLLRADLSQDSAWLQRFKRELRIMRDLAHPNVAPAYHLERVENICFFTMKFIDGETLHRRLRRQRPLPLLQGQRILCGVGTALAAAHRNLIIHRDFKSANIMIERGTEHPYLMDFGIASVPDSLGLTAAGQGIGTPIYMAPEQALGQPINIQADIFSFGVVLYEVFGGDLPFQSGTTVAVYHAQINAQYKPLRELNPSLPEALGALVERCLQPEPARRPGSMDEVLDVLRGLAA